MFDVKWPEAVLPTTRGEGVKAAKEKDEKDPVKVIWTRITLASKRPKCDVCVQRMVLGAPLFAPDPTAWRRNGHGTEVYLCYFGAAPLRAGEGLDP